MQGLVINPMEFTQKILRSAALAALLALFSMPVSAATVPGLYSVNVPVQSSQPEDMADGYAAGLSRVMVRVSGSRDVLSLEGVQALLGDAESLLQSYQYLRSEKNGDRLQMAFGAVGVNNALASVGAPVWGANRPLTLAWIAVESGGARRLLHQSDNAQASSPWLRAFQRAAEERGLPVALPPEMFADRRELMSDIWGQFTESVRSASEGLSHDLISMVRVSRSGGAWRAGWVFDGMGLGGREQSVTAGSPDELAAAVIGRWADAFAERYAVDSSDVGESPQVDIVLHGIGGLADYATANRVFRNLSPVETVGATATRNSRVTLRVAFSGEIEQLKRYVALDPRLVPLSEAEVSRLPVAEGGADEGSQSVESEPGDAGGQADSPTSANFMASPQTTTSSNPFIAYEALLNDEDETEKAFESLYQVLHYRWQPASVIEGESEPETGE